MAFADPILFDSRDTALSGTQFVAVPIEKGAIGIMLAWTDGTSSATVTLELTAWGPNTASLTSTTAWHWEDSGLTITGPAGAAAGATVVTLENVRMRRARIKIVTAADTKIAVLNGLSNA